MKILVAVKRVPDPNVRVRTRKDGSGLDIDGARMTMNPFDEIALEEALRLREAGTASEVVAVTAGPAEAADTLRTALAMGADRGILVRLDRPPEPLAVARILAALARRDDIGLILAGKQAVDDDSNQTGQMVSALLGWPQAAFASHVEVTAEGALRHLRGGRRARNARPHASRRHHGGPPPERAALRVDAQSHEGPEKAGRGGDR